MLLYDQKKKEIDVENKQRRNPMYRPPEMALPTGGRPLNKQQPGMAGTPIQPTEEPKPWEDTAFFKVKKSLGKQNPDFNKGRDQIEQIASQLKSMVDKGQLPKKMAEKKLRMAIDDFARESKEAHAGRVSAANNFKEQGKEAGEVITKEGAKLKNQVLMARDGDKEAQRNLRDAKFDWIGPQANAVVETYGGE